MKILCIPIKKKWFDMIKSGLKTEEYREIKDHWVRRFVSLSEDMEYATWDEFITDLNSPYYRHNGPDECMKYFGVKLKQFDVVKLVNGYGRNRPTITIKLRSISIGTGCTCMGAEDGKEYFILHLGKIIEVQNIR